MNSDSYTQLTPTSIHNMRNIPIAHILPFQHTNTVRGNTSTGTVFTRI